MFAINQNVPFIALSYEHKITGLLSTLGKDDCMIDFTTTMLSRINQEQCIDQIVQMLPNLQCDDKARMKAKQIAQNAFNQFVKQFNI